jgi:hypothetical protein
MRIGLLFSAVILFALSAAAQQTLPDHSNTQRHESEDLRPCGDDQTGKLAVELTEVGADSVVGDPDGKRFLHEVANELQASTLFYWWGCGDQLLPKKVLFVHLISVEVKGINGETIGSAIVLIASRRSEKDADAQRQLGVETWFVRHDEPVRDIVSNYFRELQGKM